MGYLVLSLSSLDLLVNVDVEGGEVVDEDSGYIVVTYNYTGVASIAPNISVVVDVTLVALTADSKLS